MQELSVGITAFYLSSHEHFCEELLIIFPVRVDIPAIPAQYNRLYKTRRNVVLFICKQTTFT